MGLQGAVEVERVDAVDPVELGTPLHGPGSKVPHPAPHVCQRLTLFEPVLHLGEVAWVSRCSVTSRATTTTPVTPPPGPSMGQNENETGRAVRRVGAPRARGARSGPRRAQRRAPSSPLLAGARAQDVEGPEHHVVRRPPSRRSAVAPQVVTLPSVSHKKMASSDSSTTARRTSAGSGSRSVPGCWGPTAPILQSSLTGGLDDPHAPPSCSVRVPARTCRAVPESVPLARPVRRRAGSSQRTVSRRASASPG